MDVQVLSATNRKEVVNYYGLKISCDCSLITRNNKTQIRSEELKKGNKLTMKQATKRFVRSLAVTQLGLVLYFYSSASPANCYTPTQNYSATAGAINAINECQLNNSATSGVFLAVNEILDYNVEDLEANQVDIVQTPLEEATMLEDGTIIEAEFEPYTMYVNPSWLNVRSTPSIEEENVIGKLNINDEVLVIGECEDNWVMIDYDGTTAYISSEYIQDTLPELDTYNNEWTGKKLNKHDGTVQGPSGKETYYNLNMSKCIYYMNLRGYYGYYWVRSDGCKMFGNAIMVACNLNKHPKGSYVMTSLGLGIVVDTGAFAANNPDQIDICTTW